MTEGPRMFYLAKDEWIVDDKSPRKKWHRFPETPARKWSNKRDACIKKTTITIRQKKKKKKNPTKLKIEQNQKQNKNKTAAAATTIIRKPYLKIWTKNMRNFLSLLQQTQRRFYEVLLTISEVSLGIQVSIYFVDAIRDLLQQNSMGPQYNTKRDLSITLNGISV